jgi:hypothetical protein
MDPNGGQQDKREVPLGGERLEQMRQHMTLAQDQLMSAAEVVLSEIGSEHGVEDISEIRLSINTENHPSGPRWCQDFWVATGPDSFVTVGSYMDPPGICSTEPCPAYD